MPRLTFEEWLKQADYTLESLVFLGHDDLPDQTWRDWYNDGVTPADAARMTLENEGLNLGDL